jgi:hypothetical protein
MPKGRDPEVDAFARMPLEAAGIKPAQVFEPS